MELTAALEACGIVAILRGVRPDEVVAIGDALVAAGVVIIEVPLNSPAPFDSISRLAARVGGRALVGAGTVLRSSQVHDVARAGGRLIVMPHGDAKVVGAARAAGLATMPGFATPTEAFALLDAGADSLKLFPAETSSPAGLKSMRAVLPKSALILPVGGIGPGALAPWVTAGANGFGVGSSLYSPGRSPTDVEKRASTLVAELQEARRGVARNP